MKNEKVVECWHCDHFNLRDDNFTGDCAIKSTVVFAHDTVCEEFELMQGMHTARTIPDYCKKCK